MRSTALWPGGWIIQRRLAHKMRYTPNMGAHPRRHAAPLAHRRIDYLGCPRHVFTLRLDCDIARRLHGQALTHRHRAPP